MAKRLTKKQKGFVKDYIDTGNGSLAVKRNYDVSNDLTARVIAHENLTKPNIVKSIAESLPDELLAERHLELLNKREYVKVGEEIVDSVDVQAVSKGLDMAYKIKSTYAPEKHANLNTNVDLSKRDVIKKIADEVIKKLQLEENGDN